MKNNPEQIQNIKNASLTSINTQRYRKQMLTINLGVVTTEANVYNQIINDTWNLIVFGTGNNLSRLSRSI